MYYTMYYVLNVLKIYYTMYYTMYYAMYFTMCYTMYYTMYKTYLGPISFEAKEVRGPIPDKAYTVPMKTSLAMTNLKYQLCDGTVFLLIHISDAVR